MIMRDDARKVETTGENHAPMEDTNDVGESQETATDPGSTAPGQRMSMEQNLDATAGTAPLSTLRRVFAGGRAPLIWGVLWGVLQAAAPFGFLWLDAATVYGMSIALIATVYIGFAVADGRPTVIAVETTVAGAFVVLAAAGVTGSAWLIVIGFVGHGLKDLWQHRNHYVANTRWWPPFCMIIDFVAAAIIAVAILKGVTFHQ